MSSLSGGTSRAAAFRPRVLAGDTIRLISLSSAARNIALTGSILHPATGRQLEALSGNQTTNSDRTSATTDYTVQNNGTLGQCAVVLQSGEAGGKRGECYVRVVLRRADVVIGNILFDYIYANHEPSIDMFVESGPGGGTGNPRQVNNANLLNDNDEVVTVPTNGLWEVQSVWVEYAASATLGTRTVEIRFRDGSGNIIGGYRTGNLAASQLLRILLTRRGTPIGGALTPPNVAGVPDVAVAAIVIDEKMTEAYDIRVVDAANIAAAEDDITMRVEVEEWIDV